LGILGVIMATMTFALVIVTPLSLAIANFSFRHGLDPDIVLYPVESTVSDLLITLGYLLVLTLFFPLASFGRYMIGLIDLLLLCVTVYILYRSVRQTEFLKTVKESFMTLIFVAFIVNVTGTFLGKIAQAVGTRREVYTAYPALIDTVGDVGSVVGSTATTKLALGTLKASFSAVRDHLTEIFSAWTASLMMFVVYSILSLSIQGKFTLTNLLEFTSLLISTNIMAAALIIFVAYFSAVLTYKRGLDPDNFVIPIESSMADSATTISLLIALSLIG